MAKLRKGVLFDVRPHAHVDVHSVDLRCFVDEICYKEGMKPPGWVAVLGASDRRSNAMAVRCGRQGKGFLVVSPALLEELHEDELQFVLRHELVHYRHAEARWSLLQALACFSPIFVYVGGWPISHLVGSVATLILYFVSLFVHTQAFRSKRFFELRADQQAIRNSSDADAARRALLKVATLKKRRDLGLDEATSAKVIADFEIEAHTPANFSLRMFNKIWGTHPLIQERLAMYKLLSKSLL